MNNTAVLTLHFHPQALFQYPMKRFFLLSLVFSAALHAQNPKPVDKSIDQLSAAQREFSNLPEEKRNQFTKFFTDAQRYFSSVRVFETLEALNEAEKIFPNSLEVWNLRGSCYVEMRFFDKAELAYKKALEISPNNLSVKFNVAECMFVSRQWQSAHDKFQELLKLMPPNATAITRLIEFKIFLCKKKLGLDQEAMILAEKYDYQDDSPYHYYVNAVVAFDKKDLDGAEKWMARANRIFKNPQILTPWQDTMIEYGYIKGFFGGDDGSGEGN